MDYKVIAKELRKAEEERENNQKKWRNDYLKSIGVNPDANHTEEKHDRIGTPENSIVTILYIIGMVVSLMFKDFWIAWIGLTAAYGKFITRHDNN